MRYDSILIGEVSNISEWFWIIGLIGGIIALIGIILLIRGRKYET